MRRKRKIEIEKEKEKKEKKKINGKYKAFKILFFSFSVLILEQSSTLDINRVND